MVVLSPDSWDHCPELNVSTKVSQDTTKLQSCTVTDLHCLRFEDSLLFGEHTARDEGWLFISGQTCIFLDSPGIPGTVPSVTTRSQIFREPLGIPGLSWVFPESRNTQWQSRVIPDGLRYSSTQYSGSVPGIPGPAWVFPYSPGIPETAWVFPRQYTQDSPVIPYNAKYCRRSWVLVIPVLSDYPGYFQSVQVYPEQSRIIQHGLRYYGRTQVFWDCTGYFERVLYIVWRGQPII